MNGKLHCQSKLLSKRLDFMENNHDKLLNEKLTKNCTAIKNWALKYTYKQKEKASCTMWVVPKQELFLLFSAIAQ